MRHGKKVNHLGRTDSHRKAMLANMATSLILHKRITTTLAKAKALRTYVEPLITKSKNDTTHSRRTVFAYLKDKDAVSILFREISEKVANRPGGYGKKAAAAEKKATRRRGGAKKAATAETEAPAEVKAEVEGEEKVDGE